MAKTSNIAKDRDAIEDAILWAMEFRRTGSEMHSQRVVKKKNRSEQIQMSFGHFCGKTIMKPKKVYVFDRASNGDRIFAPSLEGVIVNPVFAIGDRLETLVIKDCGTLSWMGYKPMPAPRGIAAVTNEKVYWFSCHYRTIGKDGKETYLKDPVPITESGKVPLIRAMGWKGFDAKETQAEQETQLALCLSMLEDATRTGSYLATVKESVEIMFPVGEDAYKDFFILRDGHKNTPTGRKNPIIHFCKKHIRRTNNKNSIQVEKHARGATEVVVGPMTLQIKPNSGYHLA